MHSSGSSSASEPIYVGIAIAILFLIVLWLWMNFDAELRDFLISAMMRTSASGTRGLG